MKHTWGIDEQIDNINSKFGSLNNINIKYRIFTSASPNIQTQKHNMKIYLVNDSTYKVKALIDLNIVKIKNDDIKYSMSDFVEKNKCWIQLSC